LITPDEVAGLSTDERVESRLILEKGGKSPWELRRGPFKPSLFSKLPKSHWTILVNGVDRFVPAVNGFLDHFSFIPFWRIDDVMISVAYDQGNVGAHVDNFDVFLVQAAGRREWLIEDRPRLDDDYVPGLPIRLLKRFKPTHRWVLEAGDILYLPPRFPHHGIAQGDGCMTISVGFRAPTIHEIVNGLASDALSKGDEAARYTDPELKAQTPGEITQATVKKFKDLVSKELLSDERIHAWLGKTVTEPYSDVELQPTKRAVSPAKVTSQLKTASAITRCEGTRIAFIRGEKRGALKLFVNGEDFELKGNAAKLGEALADRITVPISKQLLTICSSRDAVLLLAQLIQRGAVIVE
ncbi:MAG: JmjC domain-containing protein, partial [Pseudomonadota bacterium]